MVQESIRVLLVNYEYPPIGGGAGHVTYNVAKNLVKLGVDVHVLTSHWVKAGRPYAADGVAVHSVPSYRKGIHELGVGGLVSYIYFGSRMLRRLTKRYTYDLIHFFCSIPSGLISGFSNRVPYVVSLQGFDIPGYQQSESRLFEQITKGLNKRILKQARAVTAVSNSLKEKASVVMPVSDIRVIHNGINLKAFPFQPKPPFKPFRLVCIARLTRLKRVELLIRAVAELADDDLEVSIIGDGYERNKLVNLAQRLKVNERIRFLGYQPHLELPTILNQSHVFVLPSVGESFGIVFLEAMACGLPVIAAHSHAVPEVVTSNEGILVEPGDLDSLCAAIRKLKTDRELYGSFAENAVLRAKQFDWVVISNQYFQLYSSIFLGDYKRG